MTFEGQITIPVSPDKPKTKGLLAIVLFIVVLGFISGFLGYTIGYANGQNDAPADVMPAVSSGDTETGLYPRSSETGNVDWGQVREDRYPQLDAYDKAFRAQFPELVAGVESAEPTHIHKPTVIETGLTVCAGIDISRDGDEPSDLVYVENEDVMVKQNVANLAIEIICPEHIDLAY